MDRWLREVLEMAKSEGVENLSFAAGTKHYKLVGYVRGRKKIWTISRSPSDRHTRNNLRGDFRRAMRQFAS